MENKIMITETDRLILRRYEEHDLNDLYEYLSNSKVVEFEPYKPMTMDEVKENLKWRISTDEMIAVELKENHKMIGNVYLGKRDFDSLEIGFVFHEDYWKKGYAKESCKKLIEQAFENGIHRIFAECDPNNQNSWKLLESMGFMREGHLRKNVYFFKDEAGQPIWKDTFLYSLLNEKENIVLETERICLRNFCQQDINDMYEFCRQPEIETVGWAAHKNIEETKKVLDQWVLNENILAIVYKKTNKVIGYIAIHEDSEEGRADTKELGFALNSQYHRQGIMSEVIRRVLDYLFSKDILYVWACCIQSNISSKNLIEKIGFELIQEGTFYSDSFKKEYPSFEYRMSKESWEIK